MGDNGDNRVVVLVDMDCFYCQVEVRLAPKHTGKPLAVVQYNDWRGGGIIAVNYEARDKGVKRGMRGDQAKKLCPEIVLCKVAEVRGKADLTKYRDAGREVVDVLQEFSGQIQVASIDESYLDITDAVEKRIAETSEVDNGIPLEKLPSTFVIGHTDEKSNDEGQRISGLETWLQQLSDPSCLRLAVGAIIAEEMRAAVFDRTSFRCSAGISYNKPLAKLVCGVHKPNRQTILPADKVDLFFSTLPLKKMRNLGGKFGMEVAERLGCQTMGDLSRFSLKELQRHYDDKNGLWLYNIAHGIDHEPVTVRLIPKSIGCSKNFPGRTALATKKDVEYWLHQLISELVVRLTEDQVSNKRRAQHFTVSVSQDTEDGSLGSVTRSGSLPCYSEDRLVALALQLITKTNAASGSSLSWDPAIKNISLSAGKFTADCSSQKTSIQSFFKQVSKDNENCKAFETRNDVSQQFSSESKVVHSAQSAPQPKAKHSSVESYFRHNIASSDNDSSRDMFLDETSIGSESNEVPEELFSKGDASKGITGETSSQGKFKSSSYNHPSKLSLESKKLKADNLGSRCEQEACPESLESAVSKSFFARFILSKKGDGNKSNESLNCPSSYRDTRNESPLVMSPQAEMESEADSNNSNENNGDIFEKCGECGELIALQEFPEHVDYHSAVRLQKELNETLTPPDENVAGPSTAGGSKQHTSRHSNDSSSRDSELPSIDNQPNSETVVERCSDCGKLIPLEEFPEHIDYHSALNLQRELNKPAAPQVISNNPTVNFGKKKKGASTKQAPSPAKKGKPNPITSFFKPQ